MNITKNQIDDLNATIKIELGKEDYAGRVEKALKDYQKKVVVNGFRPGKTPMGIVKKMYGKSLLVDEINKVLGESLNNYIKENNLQILGEPLPNETEQKELNLEDENFEFLYDIALSPEVNAKMSKREKIPFYTIKVDDEMIDKQIESICKNNGNMIAVDEIGTVEDIHAIEYAMHCGCRLIASVHGLDMEEAKKKPVLGELIRRRMFERYVVLGNGEHPGEIRGIYDERGSVLCRE